MFKRKISILLTTILLTFIVVFTTACSGDDGNETRSIEGKSSPFSFKSNVITPEVKIDGVMDDALWQDENKIELQFASSFVTIVRRSDAFYLFFKTKDITPYAFVGVGDDDEVTHSDSIEFYVDSKLSRAEDPVSNCYQIDLGRDGRTRIMSGFNGYYYKWIALYTFEVKEGDTSADYDYYNVEVMIPVSQMGMGADECVGVAFGQVDRIVDSNVDLEKNFVWKGYEYETEEGLVKVDPLAPETYLVLSPKSLIEGEPNRLYTYEEYLALTADE